jgi:hypothetical protein
LDVLSQKALGFCFAEVPHPLAPSPMWRGGIRTTGNVDISFPSLSGEGWFRQGTGVRSTCRKTRKSISRLNSTLFNKIVDVKYTDTNDIQDLIYYV